MRNKVLIGDCRDILKTLPDKSIHCCVTSPPYYGLRDYGVDGQIGLEQTPEEYVNELVTVFREVKRVLRNDGTLWLNLGDSYSGGGRGGDPKHKKGSNSAENTAPSYKGIPAKNLIGIPWLVAFALQKDGWILRQDIIWQKNNPMPESVRDRCTKSHEYIFLLSKSAKYYFDNDAIKEPCAESSEKRYNYKSDSQKNKNLRENGIRRPMVGEREFSETRNKRSVWQVNTKSYSGAHFATFPNKLIEPCILAGTSEKGVCSVCGSPLKRVTEVTGQVKQKWGASERADCRPGNENGNGDKGIRTGMVNIKNTVGWELACSCNAHTIPATVLDPFGGSGTVGEVCNKLNRNFILIELNPEYEPQIIERGQLDKVTLESFAEQGA